MRTLVAACTLIVCVVLSFVPLQAAEPEPKRLSQTVAPLAPPYNEPRNFGPHVAVSEGRIAYADATLEDSKIIVADAATGETIAALRHPLDTKIKWKAIALNLAMNDKYIVSAGHTESYYPGSRRHGEILVFDAKSFEHLRTIRSPDDEWAFGFGDGPMQLDGSRVLIAPVDYNKLGATPLYLFDLETGDLVWTLTDPEKRPGFATLFSMRGDHILLTPAYEPTEIALYKVGSDTPAAEFVSPETDERATFHGPLLLTDDLALIGGAVPTKVRVILDQYADIGKLYAFERDGGALRYTITDPFPPDPDAKPAAYAAATGRATPFYGSGFPGGLENMGDRFIAGLPSYREAPKKEGALIGFDIATGKQAFMLKRDETVAGRYFAQFFAADGDFIGIYQRTTQDGIQRDAISVFAVD